MRCIPVATCRDCPSFDHKGGFGHIAYVPVCRKTGETLPHTVSAPKGRAYASATGEIPASCPLPTMDGPQP